MNELQAIVAAREATRRQGDPALLATVVRVRGSAYRRPGARMLLSSDGWLAGSISGGCLEADILRKAWWRTRNGERIVVTYDSTVPEDGLADEELFSGFGLGCNGVIEVLLERVDSGNRDCPVRFIADCLRSRRSGILATVIGAESELVGQRLLWREGDEAPVAVTIADPSLAARIGRDCRNSFVAGTGSQTMTYNRDNNRSVDVFLEVIAPPRPLIICGAGHDAAPLAQMAKTLGYDVTVVEPRAGIPVEPHRFPGADTVLSCTPSLLADHVLLDHRSFAVVMSHNVALDAALLAALLTSPVRYIGVLGPRRRTERLLAAVGSPDLQDDRLHAPVGLDIGADTPESIALAILAELQAFDTGRDGRSLRARDLPIHGRNTASVESKFQNGVREPIVCALTGPASAP